MTASSRAHGCTRLRLPPTQHAGSRDNVTAVVAFLRPVTTVERVFG